MTEAGHLDSEGDRLAEEIVLFVDGHLEPDRARRLEARAAEDPGLSERIARVRGGREQLQAAAASIEASWDLRRAVEALGEQEASPARRGGWSRVAAWLGGGRTARPRVLAGLAGVGAVAAVALALVVGGGGGPSVDQVIALAERAPVAAVAPGGGPLLRVDMEGVRFPDYAKKFGWRAVGLRNDEIDGREVRTVVYERAGRRVSYSIVAGEALEEPAGEDLEAEGTRLRRVGDSVVWQRQGHTCVMTGGPGVPIQELAELAGWKAKGEVPF